MESMLNIRQNKALQSSYMNRVVRGERIPPNGKKLRLVDLMDCKRKRLSERRKQNRLKIKDGAFCLVRSNPIGLTGIEYMSMGKIAMATLKSRPNKMGRINNISMDGLSFRYVDSQDWSSESFESDITDEAFKLDILLADRRFYLSDLPFKTIFDVDIDDQLSFNTIKMKQMGINFGALTHNQTVQLEDLIKNHSIQEDKGIL